jgi:hypothetical protein
MKRGLPAYADPKDYPTSCAQSLPEGVEESDIRDDAAIRLLKNLGFGSRKVHLAVRFLAAKNYISTQPAGGSCVTSEYSRCKITFWGYGPADE